MSISYKPSTYVSKPVNEHGYAAFDPLENEVWQELITRQLALVQDRACLEFLAGIELLKLPQDRVPQCPEVSAVLKKTTGWTLQPVPALIPIEEFFSLLANRRFPAATFIRRREELNYLQEPDIFHEVFGHCPLLTHKTYAEFTHAYGKLALKADPLDRAMLERLYWFTIEFGLIKSAKGLRAYGGGILSSINETVYSLESPLAVRKPFDVLEVLRTPYRIDIMQPIYFVLDSFDTLFHLLDMDLLALCQEARKLGEYAPAY